MRSARNSASSRLCVTNTTATPSCCPDSAELHLHELARLRVERGERLVHEQDLRLERQRAGQADALLHAARQLVRITVLEVLQADQPQVRRALAARARARGMPWICSGNSTLSSTVRHGSRRNDWKTKPACGPGSDGAIAVDQHLAAVRLEQSMHQPQQRRLATARRPDQAHELARHRSAATRRATPGSASRPCRAGGGTSSRRAERRSSEQAPRWLRRGLLDRAPGIVHLGVDADVLQDRVDELRIGPVFGLDARRVVEGAAFRTGSRCSSGSRSCSSGR